MSIGAPWSTKQKEVGLLLNPDRIKIECVLPHFCIHIYIIAVYSDA